MCMGSIPGYYIKVDVSPRNTKINLLENSPLIRKLRVVNLFLRALLGNPGSGQDLIGRGCGVAQCKFERTIATFAWCD